MVVVMVEVVVMTVLMNNGNDVDTDNLLRPHPRGRHGGHGDGGHFHVGGGGVDE